MLVVEYGVQLFRSFSLFFFLGFFFWICVDWAVVWMMYNNTSLLKRY